MCFGSAHKIWCLCLGLTWLLSLWVYLVTFVIPSIRAVNASSCGCDKRNKITHHHNQRYNINCVLSTTSLRGYRAQLLSPLLLTLLRSAQSKETKLLVQFRVKIVWKTPLGCDDDKAEELRRRTLQAFLCFEQEANEVSFHAPSDGPACHAWPGLRASSDQTWTRVRNAGMLKVKRRKLMWLGHWFPQHWDVGPALLTFLIY